MTGQDHDALLVDLDGTVYRGPDAVEGAVASLEAARDRGARIAYVTNNASRGPDEVAGHLAELGLTVGPDDVVTSAQAAAAVLAETCPAEAKVLVVGTDSLGAEIRYVGLIPVRRADEEPTAVVQGHSPETGWAELAEAALALGRGARWVACNVDATLPSDRGILPGNGSMVAALRTASGREPDVAGKPAAPLMRQSVERVGARHPLVVGDRLDTDIAGAHAIEAESLLVLTGVSTARDLLAAPASQRPTHVAADLRVLDPDTGDLAAARIGDGEADGWRVTTGDALVLSGRGDAIAALRVLCRAAWDGAEGPVAVRADGADAARVITALDLPHA